MKRLWAALTGAIALVALLVIVAFLGLMAIGVAIASLPYFYYALQIVVACVVVGPFILTWLYFTEKSDDDGLTKWRRKLNKWKSREG